jgi:hypothetical protein
LRRVSRKQDLNIYIKLKICYDKIRSKDSELVEVALEELSQNPEDPKAREELQQEISELLKEDPDLANEIEHIIININAKNIDQLTVGNGNSSYSFESRSGDFYFQFFNYPGEIKKHQIKILRSDIILQYCPGIQMVPLQKISE